VSRPGTREGNAGREAEHTRLSLACPEPAPASVGGARGAEGAVDRARSSRFTIGVLSQLLAGAYFGSLLQGVAEGAWAEGGRVVGFQTRDTVLQDDDYSPSEYLSRLAWEHVDGFIVVVHGVDREYWRAIKQAGKPVVFISPVSPDVPGPAIVPDNQQGTYNAVRHLVGHGHRRIAFAGLLEQEDIRQRYEGYLAALVDCGIEANSDLLYSVENNMEPSGRRAAQAMIAAGLPSTAVVAGCDYNAIGIIEALKLAGYSLPRDQAVVGFDDLAMAPHMVPALASVRQPLEQMGRLAAQLVARQLRGEDVPPERHVVPTEFIPRESCGCLLAPTLFRTQAAAQDVAGGMEGAVQDAGTPSCSAAENLVATLRSKLSRPGAGKIEEGTLAELAGGLVSCLGRIGTGDELAEARSLQDALAGLYQLRPRQQTVETIIEALQQYRDDLTRDGKSTKPFDRGWTSAMRVLAHLPSVQQSAINRQLQTTMFNEYQVTVALLRESAQDPRALRWLEPTQVSAACLGLWAGQPGWLEVVGTFQREPGPALPRSEMAEQFFPPLELLDRADSCGDVTHVLPVRGNGKSWGALALNSPIETVGTTGMDVFYQWTGLLAAALDRDEMLASLQHQAEELAQAVQREHELVADLRRSEERYALAASAASDGLWDFDVNGGSVYYSPRWKQVLGYVDKEIGDSLDEWLSRAHPDDKKLLTSALNGLLQGSRTTMEVEHRLAAASGSYIWAHCRALAVPGGGLPARRIVGSLTDITRRRELEDRLRQRALYDNLTGLPNRSLFLENLEAGLSAGIPEDCALFFVDLDNFKSVNDTLGHDAGDELLVVIAKRISGSLRPGDVVARYGGDEFVAFARGVSMTGASEIAERLRSAVSLPVDLGPARVHVGCSVGIAMSNGANPASLIQYADAALYRAKERGRDRCEFYDAATQGVVRRRSDIEDLLRITVAEDNLVVVYRPIVNLAAGEVGGSEALARLCNRPGELLDTGEFMGVAEESGLVVPLGAALLERACAQQATWGSNGTGPSYVAVNLSPRQLTDRFIVAQVAESLAITELKPDQLCLELSETALVEAGALARRALDDLKALGVMLAVSDFGSGGSGLSHLRQFPIDALKLDASLVSSLGGSDRDASVINALVGLGHALGMFVVASGVTEAHQADALSVMGCDYALGPLYGEPVLPEAWGPHPRLQQAKA
jgi:diguanylate cyclase (GGDEF)-like protein/PAS domain S-box-containing protein